MTTVQRYLRPASAAEVLEARRADPSARYLAGGTVLLAGDDRDKPESVIDLGGVLTRGISREGVRVGGLAREGAGAILAIGAGTTFQELAQSKEAPRCLVEAALTMVNRNTRNRGTVGGNLGADKSCSSLVPLLVALETEVEVVSPSSPEPRRFELESWLRSRSEASELERTAELVLRVFVPLRARRRAAYRRWNRVACDLSVIGAAVAYEIESSAEGELLRDLHIALGGLGPKARRFPILEALFEGKPLLPRGEIEAAVAPLLKPIDDLRASAAFKRMRGAQLLADAMLEAADDDIAAAGASS